MMVVDALLNRALLLVWVGRVWKLPKLSAMPAVVAIPRNKNIILPFILLVLVVLFDCRKKITPKRLFIV